MSYVYTGNSRSLKVTVTKYVNGVPQTPVTYPTATDIANGYFTYSGGVVNLPTPEELAQMDESSYAALLIAFQTYVQEANPGLNFATATISVGAVIVNDPDCPAPGTQVAYPFNIKYGALPADACDGTTYTVYSSVPSPGVGDFIYKDIALTQPWDIAMSVLFVSPALFGGFPAAVAILAVPPYSPGEIMAITDYDCDVVPEVTTTTTPEAPVVTTTTTCVPLTAVTLRISSSSELDACSAPALTYYMDTVEFGVGTFIFSDICGESPAVATHVILHDSGLGYNCTVNEIVSLTGNSC
jgi:hypothetical protein